MEFVLPEITIIFKKYFTNEALDYFCSKVCKIEQDTIADIDNSINAISTKVTDIDRSLDKNINSFSYAKNE